VIAIFCGRLRAGERPRIYGDGMQTRDYIYVEDLVQALLSAGESTAGDVVNIGTETETTVLELLRVLCEHHGPGAPQAQFAPARSGEIDRSCLDATRARQLLGWHASTPITQGLRQTYDAVASTS
jgi:UDP-glucose 4-epimerase